MATGDSTDLIGRLQRWLPDGWFPTAPVSLAGRSSRIYAYLAAFAAAFEAIWQQQIFVRAQARLDTTEAGFLDLFGYDFFRGKLPRKPGETDDHYRARIEANLLAEKATRRGLVNLIHALCGQPPDIFEPALASDTGGYDLGGLGYDAGGGWGSLDMPFEFFITCYPPSGGGIARSQGYYDQSLGAQAAIGGYDQGLIQYADLTEMRIPVSDQDVYDTILDAIPAGTTAWTHIDRSGHARTDGFTTPHQIGLRGRSKAIGTGPAVVRSPIPGSRLLAWAPTHTAGRAVLFVTGPHQGFGVSSSAMGSGQSNLFLQLTVPVLLSTPSPAHGFGRALLSTVLTPPALLVSRSRAAGHATATMTTIAAVPLTLRSAARTHGTAVLTIAALTAIPLAAASRAVSSGRGSLSFGTAGLDSFVLDQNVLG